MRYKGNKLYGGIVWPMHGEIGIPTKNNDLNEQFFYVCRTN